MAGESARITDILSLMANDALADDRPAPVIETDVASARILAEFIYAEMRSFGICATFGRLPDGVIVQFAGVKVVARPVEQRDLYREHFGPLVDIWG